MNRTTSMSQPGSADFAMECEQIPDSSAVHMESGITSNYSCSNKPREPAHFLDACRLCNRRLNDGRDIYMYRGDTALCSVECRQQQIDMDERKEKNAAGITGMKKGGQISSSNRYENSTRPTFWHRQRRLQKHDEVAPVFNKASAILALVKHRIKPALSYPSWVFVVRIND